MIIPFSSSIHPSFDILQTQKHYKSISNIARLRYGGTRKKRYIWLKQRPLIWHAISEVVNAHSIPVVILGLNARSIHGQPKKHSPFYFNLLSLNNTRRRTTGSNLTQDIFSLFLETFLLVV